MPVGLRCTRHTHLWGEKKKWDMIKLFSALVGDPSVVTTTLIVTGVLLVCAIGGGLILAKVVNRLRKRPKTLEYCDVCAPSATV